MHHAAQQEALDASTQTLSFLREVRGNVLEEICGPLGVLTMRQPEIVSFSPHPQAEKSTRMPVVKASELAENEEFLPKELLTDPATHDMLMERVPSTARDLPLTIAWAKLYTLRRTGAGMLVVNFDSFGMQSVLRERESLWLTLADIAGVKLSRLRREEIKPDVKVLYVPEGALTEEALTSHEANSKAVISRRKKSRQESNSVTVHKMAFPKRAQRSRSLWVAA